nr:amidohydrolase family protein [Kordiimonas sp. SCSIO 12610]
MLQILKIGFALLTLNFLAIPSKADDTSYDLLIKNVILISPERDLPLKNVHIAIKGDKIVRVSREPIKWHAKKEIDGTGKYLTPGLIDSHVHLYHAPGLKRHYTSNYDALYNQYLDQMPRSYLYYGYTTIVETNADVQSNKRFLSTPIHPELIHCGKGVILSDGFMAMEFPKKSLLSYAPNFLHDRFNDGYLPNGVDAADHSPKAVVKNRLKAGAKCLKIYYEEALWMPEQERKFSLPSVQIMQELVSEAHAHNLPVILHGTSPAAYSFGANVGVDIMAHGLWDWRNNNYSLPDVPENVTTSILEVAKSGIKVQPTFGALRHTISMFDFGLLERKGLKHALPTDFISYLKTDGQRQKDIFLRLFGEKIVTGGGKKNVSLAMEKMFTRYGRIVGDMNSKKVRFLFGTDTSSGGFGWGSLAGFSSYVEMQNWEQSGISLKSIFAAATQENARAFGIQDRLGTIEEGKQANLLLLTQNPWETIEAYDNIEWVVLGGVAHDRNNFSALKDDTSKQAVH